MSIDTEKARWHIDDEEVIRVARELVAIPSITHREGMGMARYMERWFGELGIPVRIYPADDGDRANFFADWGATSGPGRYLFNGHMDTKPVEGMTVDPFAGEIRDGRMYGRGTCDMKGGLAAVLCAVRSLVRSGYTPKRGITFYSDIEEEWGGGAGYYWARDHGFLDGFEGVISAEPTGLEIHVGCRGVYIAAFEFRGRSAHSGLPHLGVNAIVHAARFIDEFLKLPYLTVQSPIFGRSTCNFERIEGGNYLAAIPDRCVVCLDSRLIPETPPELVQEQVDGLITRLKRDHGMDIRETEQPEGWREKSARIPSEYIPSDHPLVSMTAEAVRHTTGEDAVIAGCGGIGFPTVVIQRGTPAVMCGPGGVAQAHTEDEWIDISQLAPAARIYARLMEGM